MTKYEVVIVGLGPVGASLAALLGREGIRVAVVERYPTIFDRPRAIVLDHEALRVLQACRIDPKFFDGVSPHPGTDYLGVDGKLIKTLDALKPPFPLGWPPTVTFVQPELEAELRKAVAACNAVDVILGEEAIGMRQDADGAVLTTQDPATGRIRELAGDFLVGCDGANSLVRKGIGSELIDQDFDEWWVVVDARLTGKAELPARVTQYCYPSRPGTLVIGPGNLRRWEIKLLPGEDPKAFEDQDTVKAVLAKFVDVDAIDIWRSAVYRFGARVASDWRRDRVFIAGDAAHQTPPFLGQGLCTGLRDAANLGWKLSQVLRRGALPAVLATYGEERRAHTETVIRHTKDLGLIIGELDEAKALERDRELRAALAAGTMTVVRQILSPD